MLHSRPVMINRRTLIALALSAALPISTVRPALAGDEADLGMEEAITAGIEEPPELSPDTARQKKRASAFAPHGDNYLIYDPKDEVVKFEISFKLRPLESYPLYLAYTQKSLWDVGEDSLPFRETNYGPEIFFVTDDTYLKGGQARYRISFGFQHESNGLAGDDSRSWNRGYIEPALIIDDSGTGEERHKLLLKIWPYVRASPQNSDIKDYYGYGELRLVVGMKSVTAEVAVRKGTGSGRGSVRAQLKFDPSRIEYPIMRKLENLNIFPYLQYWQGEGESLLTYDKETSRWGFGFLFAW